MMQPERCAIIVGTQARTQTTGARRLIAITRSQ